MIVKEEIKQKMGKEITMAYKIIALDLDGTLTNSEKKITPKTKEALFRIQEKGIKVVLASGRPTPGVVPLAEELKLKDYGSYILSYNGAKITNCKTNEAVCNVTLPKKIIKEVYEEAILQDAGIITYEDGAIVVGNGIDRYIEIEAGINKLPLKEVDNFVKYVDFDVNKCLLTGHDEHMARVERNFAKRFGTILNIYRSEPFFVEIMPKGIDKAESLDNLLKQLGYTREELICCGDGFNDLSMIKYAGLGVAMANAQDKVKEAADFITLSNDEDGVAYVIEKFIEGIE